MTKRYSAVVIGGGLGAVAAALALSDLKINTLLLAHDVWLGGQISGQGVPPDEHPWIESLGATRRYSEMRFRLRERYRNGRPLNEFARYNGQLNPGMGRVSRLCGEPRLFAEVFEDMTMPAVAAGVLTILRDVWPVAADVDGDEIRRLTVEFADGRRESFAGDYFIDGSEFGDLIEIAGAESVVGAESREEYGELHAPEGADCKDQQAASWCAALEYCPGEDHRGDAPAGYERWKTHTLPGWPGPLFSWTDVAPDTLEPRFKSLWEFEHNEQGRDEFSLWIYRRMRAAEVYLNPEAVREITLVNWVHIDYTGTPLVGVDRETRERGMAEAREQTLAFIHWLQNDAPRHDGGAGYPELKPAGQVMGTRSGLAREIYVREARRIRALRTVTEGDVGVDMRSSLTPGAEQFSDTVGVGSYRIDLHPSPAGRTYVDLSTWPFQIPLSALIPVRMRNLIPASKNIGTTHITNGCYRLHPVEWNIGEAAGVTAAVCLQANNSPVQAAAGGELLEQIQSLMGGRFGADLVWPLWARETPRLGAEMPGQRS